jgi:propanol-preferring alcohol dehydrogenase
MDSVRQRTSLRKSPNGRAAQCSPSRVLVIWRRKRSRAACAWIGRRFPYELLWGERQVVSVANLTRQDGRDFLRLAPRIGIVTKTTPYALQRANEALADLRAGRFEGAAVLVP